MIAMDAERADIMREKATLESAIQTAQANIKENKKTISSKNGEIKDLEKNIKEYISTNTTAMERDLLQKKQSKFFKLGAFGAIAAVVLALILIVLKLILGAGFNQSLWIVLLVVSGLILGGGIASVIYGMTFGKSIKALSQDLATFDVHKNELEDQIASCQKAITNCKKAIKKEESTIDDCEDELRFYKYEQLFQGHVMVFVGEKVAIGGKYKTIVNTIEIDGFEQGFADRPFKALRLLPGDHTIKVTVQTQVNNEYQNVASEVLQINVDEQSLYMVYEFKGANGGLVCKQYTDIIEFFDATNQEP